MSTSMLTGKLLMGCPFLTGEKEIRAFLEIDPAGRVCRDLDRVPKSFKIGGRMAKLSNGALESRIWFKVDERALCLLEHPCPAYFGATRYIL